MSENPVSEQTAFRYPISVRVAEVDMANVVFNAHYLGWCDDARLSFLAELGFTVEWFQSSGQLPLVRHADVNLLAPLRMFDKAEVEVKVIKVGGSSFVLGHEISRVGDGVVAAQIAITYVNVELAKGTKRDLPQELAEALRARLVSAE